MISSRGFTLVSSIFLCALISGCSYNDRQNNIQRPETIQKLESTVSIRTVKDNVYLEDKNIGGLTPDETEKIVREYASRSDKPPENAVLNEKDWSISHESKPGKKVKIEETMHKIFDAPDGEKVTLATEEIQPSVTSKHLTDNITLISYFSTPILDGGNSRLKNIRLAIEKIDYKKLQPGEEFSFNTTVGRRSEDTGYEMAPVIIKSEDGYEKGFDFGGGICQISSTMYNAVEKCGLQITERHIHGKEVGYVPRGDDATVSYGWADFKFINNRSHPIMLRVVIEGGEVRAEIFENTI